MDRLTPKHERHLDEARRATRTYGPPPTIAQIKTEGCIGFYINCNAGPLGANRCGQYSLVRWAEIDLPDDLPFPEIRNRIRARCTRCGGRGFSITPDASHRKMPGY